jgi:hypothetical protein
MKLSNKIWSLYSSNFQYIDDKLKKDPELTLPEVRQSLLRSGAASNTSAVYTISFQPLPPLSLLRNSAGSLPASAFCASM